MIPRGGVFFNSNKPKDTISIYDHYKSLNLSYFGLVSSIQLFNFLK